MTVSVRPWDQIAADLRASLGWSKVGPEAAVAGDALATEVARLDGYLTNCDAAREEVIAQRDALAAAMIEVRSERDTAIAKAALCNAKLAAVHAALDQYDKDAQTSPGHFVSFTARNGAVFTCVSAIAKAVER